MTYVQPVADWRLTVDGNDISKTVRPRLQSLELTDKRAGEADELRIVLTDTDGRLALPESDAKIQLQLGWLRGTGVTVGLVDKGIFVVDQVEAFGPPDLVSITARSAAIPRAVNRRREKSWHHTTIGAVVADIAGQHGWTPKCHADLAGIAVKSLVQSRKGDLAMLRELGRAHDAIATVKGDTLVFAPVGKSQSAGGQPLAGVTIERHRAGTHRYVRAERDGAAGVTAEWHDRKSASRKSVTVGKAGGAKKLGRVYASEANAKRAATAEQGRAERAVDKLSIEIPYGDPRLFPDVRVTTKGYKAEIDAKKWLSVEVKHSLDAGGGYRCAIELEAAPG